MIKIENTETFGWEAAVRGMRNPLNSWEKSDSGYLAEGKTGGYVVGNNDMKLMKQLVKAGSDHSKFMRMIVVTADITAPTFFNAELDTYKVGTVRNSCSKMHTLEKTPISFPDFSLETCMTDDETEQAVYEVVGACERLRAKYLKTGDKRYWRMLIELLPESFNQRFTWQASYAVLRNIYRARRGHKLTEWHTFCKWIERLPYSELITEE